MEIKTRTKCEYCDGTGMTYNTDWKEYFIKIKELEKEYPNKIYSEIKTIAESKGICEPSEPEELTCWECEGTGYMEKWIGLDLIFKNYQKD